MTPVINWLNYVRHESATLFAMLQTRQCENTVSFISTGAAPIDQMNLYDMNGRNFGHYIFEQNKAVTDLPPGLYVYGAFSQYGELVFGKLSAVH